MKKKFLSSFLFAALVGGAISTFTACSDYDDDIKNLQQQIDENASHISEIENLIKSGSVITNVTSVENGVKVTLSDGKEFTVTNGTDGANGTVWTISEDGYWVKDGVKTEYKALGEKGDKGDKGEQGAPGADGKDGINGTNGADGKDGEDGKDGAPGADGKDGETVYYKPDGTGYFDQYKLDAEGKEVLVKDNAVCYLEEGVVTAVMDNEFLTLNGIKTADGTNTVKISLSGDLRSLVFMPKMYLDGIETIKYPWLQTTSIVSEPKTVAPNWQDKTCTDLEDYSAPVSPEVCNYGPVWGVDYHMNPSNSNVQSADVVEQFQTLCTEVYYTRAAEHGYVVSYREKTDWGKTVFNTSDKGVLTVGMQIDNPDKLNRTPTANDANDDQVIALQVKSNSTAAKDGVITSDYALIRPMKTTVEGLVWVKKPMYGTIKEADRTETGDMECSFTNITNKKVHVWNNPEDAIADDRKAALELYYDSKEGITISDYLGICYTQEDVYPQAEEADQKWNNGVWKFGEEKDYGLTYEFRFVDYKVDGNKTSDSKFAKMLDASTGKIRAWNVQYDESEYPEEGATSQSTIDREPLVQVLVKDHCGRVVLDGYILVHITAEAAAAVEAENKIFDWRKPGEAEFDLCNGEDVLETTWAQFNDWVLTQEMDNMTKVNFDKQYEIDKKGLVGTAPDGGNIYSLNVYTTAPNKGGAATLDNFNYGTVTYVENTEGTTNHVFKWSVSEILLESWTHHATTLPVEKSIYVRYKAIAGTGAKYPYIYIKFTGEFTRENIGKVKFEVKNDNYWYGLDGSDAGWEAIVNDVNEPRDGEDIVVISHDITKTLVGNAAKVAGKYYFLPETYEITAQDGTTYVVTAQSNATDVDYKKLYCLHVTTPTADSHDFDKATLNDLLNKCAIDYNKGTFANNKLYAHVKNSSTYTLIAEMDQNLGIITLNKNNVTKAVLNAIGYEPNHTNINKELRSWIGYVAKERCEIASIVEDNIFLASWQRPINLKSLGNHVEIDATTNGCTINILDFLKLYDWRGETVGYMWGDQQWFWAYYGVKAITIDLRPDVVTTDMHNGVLGTTKLIDITTKLNLFNIATLQRDRHKYEFGTTISAYNAAAKNNQLVAAMKDQPEVFGGIRYENNGENVTEFTVRIPVAIEYEWGELIETLDLTIKRTAGN